MKVKVRKLTESAVLPTYATPGAACFDLYTTEAGLFGLVKSSREFSTGLSFEIPEGHAMLIFSRSGHGFKDDVRLANCVGVIDSDYRGEVMIKLTCDRLKEVDIKTGDRVAQAMIVPIPLITFVEDDNLSISYRGENGFGSTGR